MYLCRYSDPEGAPRLGVVRDGAVYDVTERWGSMADLLRWSVGHVAGLGEALHKLTTGAAPVGRLADMLAPAGGGPRLLKPTDAQEVWAAGVTYERSRVAREEESAGSGIYDRVYTAPRPEIFFKATPSRTVGPGEPVAVRADSRWNVPEPELALIINPALELVGFTIGNDMSSRDIEGENPLYLPQAKVYARCCALGPLVACCDAIPDPKALTVRLTISRAGAPIFAGEVSTSKIVRSYEELIAYLGRDNLFPDGVVLLTGTGIVPPDDVSLEAGDEVAIAIDRIGELRNPVVRGTS
ncbi:MAG TPA: fumarylacetoacetate hydrolase family protein [Roseiflexaceae bacterium]|nr:fumarylacetoacetate hydrolase family protein [Roseiflexaceae bacterium]